MKNTYIPLAPTKDMYFSSAWFGRWKVPFTEIKKRKMSCRQRCRAAAQGQPVGAAAARGQGATAAARS
jgi:hypothetical protein